MGRVKRRRGRRRKCNRFEDAEEYNDVLVLKKWMRMKDMKLKVVTFGGAGRGVIASTNVQSGQELLAVPLQTMVTVDVVNRSPISSIFRSPIPSPQIAIALWLVYQEHLQQESDFYCYINVLPKNFSCLLFCSEREHSALPSWIQKPVDDRLQEAKDGYQAALSTVASSSCGHCGVKHEDIFSFDKFLWAWSCVNTRCVYYEDEEVSQDGEAKSSSSIAMAPFLDFFNHSNSAEVEAKLDLQNGVYLLKTKKPYAKYDQIFIKYGAFPNLRLLVEYGFILHDDDQDVVEFTFEEIMRAVRSVNPQFADISKLKFKFITINSLNVKLSKSKSEFSWNCNGLLYILVTQDTNLAELLSKTYSSTWCERDSHLIKQIQQRIIEQKHHELISQLTAMEKIEDCSEGFSLAKDLVRQYDQILKAG